MADEKMSLIDKLAKEADRKTQDDWQKVYLYKEGTFFHAFNQSAWLLTTFIYSEDFRKSLGDNRGLQVSHTVSKMAGDYLVAGFPIRSLDKYVTGCEIEEIDDVFVCKVNPMFMPTQEAEVYQTQYETFKSAIHTKEPKPKKGSSVEVVALGQRMNGKGGMFEIIKQIMAYRLEESNPIEAMNFVARLKAMVGELL